MKKSTERVKRAVIRILNQRFNPRCKLNYRNRGVINFIDVGSIGGLPSPWNSNADKIRFLLNFEPNEKPKSASSSLTYNTALWECDEIRPFYISKGCNSTGSSLFKQNFDYVRKNWDKLKDRGPAQLAETWFERSEIVMTKELKCRSLDEILNEEFPDKLFHFLKLDVQGAEYNILKGASNLLSTTLVGIHLELFTIPLYEGIALLEDVEAYLSNFGFNLVKKFPPHGTFDSQHDCLFLNENRNPSAVSVARRVYEI